MYWPRGETAFFGFIIDARYARRHRELRIEAARRGLDVVLDPATHGMATIGGYSPSVQQLPWELDRPHRADDFMGAEGRLRARQIADFALSNNFTQLLGPTHILASANDIWFRRDIDMMKWVRTELDRNNSKLPLLYPLALPMQILRDAVQRRAIIAAIADAPADAIWLRIENFGQDASGEKVAAYISACDDFRELGRPLVADFAGGLPGIGLLAFGAAGGVAHGITLFESFKASAWRRPRPETEQAGGVSTRVYIAQLDMLLKVGDARAFLESSTRVKSHFGCRNTHCCPRGTKDQLENPARHYVYTRSDQITRLSSVPTELRIGHYLDEHVRRVSDDIAAVARYGSISAGMRKAIEQKQKTTSRFRQAMVHLAQTHSLGEPLAPPLRRTARENQKQWWEVDMNVDVERRGER